MKNPSRDNLLIDRRMLEVVVVLVFQRNLAVRGVQSSEKNFVTSTRGCRANHSWPLKVEYQIASFHSLWFVDVCNRMRFV